jgi:hypothetical protein
VGREGGGREGRDREGRSDGDVERRQNERQRRTDEEERTNRPLIVDDGSVTLKKDIL